MLFSQLYEICWWDIKESFSQISRTERKETQVKDSMVMAMGSRRRQDSLVATERKREKMWIQYDLSSGLGD